MTSVSLSNVTPHRLPLALATANPQPLSGQTRGLPAPSTQREGSRAEGDRELAITEYHSALLRAANRERNITLRNIPSHSTFGQWWTQLHDAFQSPDVRQWVRDKGIDTTSIRLNPTSGQITFSLQRALDPAQKLHTVGQDDARWAAISGPVLHAARVIAAGHADTTFKPPASLSDEPVPWWLIGRFYNEPQDLTGPALRERAKEIDRNQGFTPLDPGISKQVIQSRSEEALQAQKAFIGDIENRYSAASELRHLAASVENGSAHSGQIADEIKARTLNLSSDSAYRPSKHGTSNTVALSQYLTDHGLNLPDSHEELVNLATALSTPTPKAAVHGNLAGALRWLDEESLQQLKADIRGGTFGSVTLSPFTNALDYLLDNRPISADELSHPRLLIEALINSPRGKALGEAIQAVFAQRGVKGTGTDWLLAALNLQVDSDAGDGLKIEGYRLVSPENVGKTAAMVFKELVNHLVARGKASSPETAMLQAHWILARLAPEFRVRGIPDTIVPGTHSWVSFATVVARIEAKAPGATAAMSYAQIMLEGNTAPVSDEESATEYAAQANALKAWAVANGQAYPSTEAAMAEVRKAFTAQINELKEAAQTDLGALPTTRAIALEQLKKALPHMDPKLFDEKCITVQPAHKRLPGPYSLLDSYIDGRPLFWTPNRADFWSEEARQFTNLFKTRENEQKPDETPAAWVSSSSAFNFDEVRERLKSLPRPQELFEQQFSGFSNALKKTTAAQYKLLLAKLPLEDRQHLQFGKMTIRKEISYHRADHPLRVADGVLLVETEYNGKVMHYAIDRTKGTITRRPGQTYHEYAPTSGILPHPGKRYDVIKPAGDYPAAVRDETTDARGAPDSFNSARTRYIVDAVLDDLHLPEVERYAKGATTFDTQVPLHEKIEQIVTGLIPFKSGIENIINGNLKEGLVEVIVDLFGFAVGVGGALKGAKGFIAGASSLSKVGHVGKIIGRATVGALNPLSGLDDLARGAWHAGKQLASVSYHGVRQLRAQRSVNLLELAKKPDVAEGTYKALNGAVENKALAKLDEASGQWYAFDPRTRQAFGKPLDNFIADSPGAGTPDSLQAIGSADAVKTAGLQHGLAAKGRFKAGHETVEGIAVMFQGNWHRYDAIKKQPFGAPLKDFVPDRIAAGNEVRPLDTGLLGYEAKYIAADELAAKGLQGNVYVGRGQNEYVKVDGMLYKSRLKEGQRVIQHPKGTGPDIPVKDLGASGWEPATRAARLLGGTSDIPLRWKLGDSTYVVPMDDIKVVENSTTPFTLTYKGVAHNVIFDSSAGAWKESNLSTGVDPLNPAYFWRSGKGKWQRGPFNEFVKARKADAHNYSFVDVLPPSAVKVPNDIKPIPKNLHYFWAGQEIPPKLMDTLVNNATQAPGYKSILHVDADTPAIFQKIKHTLETKAPGLEVKNLHEDDVFKQLKGDEMYDYFRQGQGKNLAAASDVARYPIVNKYGGFYLDTDDVIQAKVGTYGVNAGASDVLLNRPVAHSLTDYKPFYNTSNFGTQAGNPVITAMIDEMKQRFASNKPYFAANRPTVSKGADGRVQYTPEFNTYERKIFETVGPTLFNQVLKSKRPDMYDLGFDGITKESRLVNGKLESHGPIVNIENDVRQYYIRQGIVPPETLGKQLDKLKQHYYPLHHTFKVRIGAEHSWINA
ncbi:glycosyltransferase [Pseudomonas sp. MWU13-2517]|uniref:glycosyltransferase n=1 Tax=Pseudomonas sp. MWU13-2517 TaxID=2929055 RepID=UPI00200C6E74|nr:glycosyltransferase [Pseudomonas sp. MWU13-2517]